MAGDRHARCPPGQTRDGKLGHLEFLQVLCKDEIARRETAALARRVQRARFEQHNTFEDFDFTVSPKLPTAMLRVGYTALARRRRVGDPLRASWGRQNPCGTALGHQVARRGGDIRFVKCSRLLADLAGGHADRTIGQRMREYTRPLVLIVDDFAMREHTPTQSDDLYDLVSDRAIAAKPLILTSNRAPRLVSTVAEPCRRRISARPARQHQPPSINGRPVLPTPERPPPDNHRQLRYRHHSARTWGIT